MLIDRRETDPVGFHLQQARGAIADAMDFPRYDCVRDQSIEVAREHLKAALAAATMAAQAAQIQVLAMLAAQRRLEAIVGSALEAR